MEKQSIKVNWPLMLQIGTFIIMFIISFLTLKISSEYEIRELKKDNERLCEIVKKNETKIEELQGINVGVIELRLTNIEINQKEYGEKLDNIINLLMRRSNNSPGS